MRMHAVAAALVAAAFALGSGTPARAAEMTEHERTLYEAAKANGESVTWYIAHFSADTAETVGRAFRERYPDVPVNVARTTAQVAFQRLSQDLRAGVAQCDVFSTTDPGHFVYLKENDLLLEYRPENVAELLKPLRDGHDPDGFYHTTHVALVAMSHNTNLVPEEEAPKSWTDLLDPKWKDQIALGHPGFSGRAGVWGVAMRNRYGWEFFEKLEANKPQIGRSMNDPLTMMNAGERSIGVTSVHSTRLTRGRGNPIEIIYPADGAILMEDSSAIPKNTKNPNAAKLFMEFLLSEGMARVMVETGGEPMRPEVDLPAGYTPIEEIKTFRVPVEDVVKGVPEVIEDWRDLFGT